MQSLLVSSLSRAAHARRDETLDSDLAYWITLDSGLAGRNETVVCDPQALATNSNPSERMSEGSCR